MEFLLSSPMRFQKEKTKMVFVSYDSMKKMLIIIELKKKYLKEESLLKHYP